MSYQTSQRRLTRPVSHLVSSCPRELQASRLEWAAGVAEVRHRVVADTHFKAVGMVALVEETGTQAEGPAATGPAAMVQAATVLETIHGPITLA